METINNAYTATTRAIWGEGQNTTTESGQEPISGKTGNTSSGEPYDAGNTGSMFYTTNTLGLKFTLTPNYRAHSNMTLRQYFISFHIQL